jgi:putative transposase
MPSGLRRFQQTSQTHLHYLTFSCYRRQPKLRPAQAKATFERALEATRLRYGLCVIGYVIMPEHVHLLLSEPWARTLATALQGLKQSVSRQLSLRRREPFWQARYYDFNVWTERKRIEKLRYIHRNPVTRGLVARPEDWAWSSYRHYLTGLEGTVEVESEWTAARRRRIGLVNRIEAISRPSKAWTGHPGPVPKARSGDKE